MELSKDWIEKWAKNYDDDPIRIRRREAEKEDKIFKDIGKSPAHLTKEVLIKIAVWKTGSGRITKKRLNGEKDGKYIESVTKISLDAYKEHNERLMLEVLTLLPGVKVRMASAILYFCFPEEYTTMDRRAWKALKDLRILKVDIKDDFEHWKMYNKACLKTAKDNIVPLRELDKALWVLGGKK